VQEVYLWTGMLVVFSFGIAMVFMLITLFYGTICWALCRHSRRARALFRIVSNVTRAPTLRDHDKVVQTLVDDCLDRCDPIEDEPSENRNR
jgi:hypothetical protein